ncbi:MAG: type II secretion system F family protein [Candidatus Omnitrophica bacterium]|nr:type II secretion system F family protein [Candidatus Omnitrophota bacterium]
MAKFEYKVRDEDGKLMEGVLEASSETSARDFLADHQYQILALKAQARDISFKEFFARFAKVKETDFNFFVRQLATLLKAGVPMLTALSTLKIGIKDDMLRESIAQVYLDIEKGGSFSESIAKHSRVFNPLFIATVKSGEAIGELDTVLLRLAELLERDYYIRSKIKSALRYPMFAMSILILAFFGTTLFIIPRFESLFLSFGAELPLPTRILLGASKVVINYWYFVVIALIVTALLARRHYQTADGKRFWHRLVLNLPIAGEFLKLAMFARFSRMLGMMLKSGVNVLQALEMIAEIAGNVVVSEAVLRVREKVGGGEGIAAQMAQEEVFPPLLVQITGVGEESGKMDELLLQIAGYYEGELEIMAKNMESLIEPIFILLLAGFVLLLALGIFLPMWNMNTIIQQSA